MSVRFGRPTPWRGIVASLVFGVGATLIGVVFALLSPHPENAPLLLLFLLIPAIAIPLLVAFNQQARFDQRTGLISINGAPPVPLTHIVWARTMTNRWSISTLELGTGLRRSEQFTVVNGPFGNPRIERDWVRHLLPYTGLPRRGTANEVPSDRPYSGPSLDQVLAFARERLR